MTNQSVSGKRKIALIVGLRAQYGIECPLLIAERGERDAVEREAHGLGRGIELRLQALQLAHVAMPATPHAEGGEKEQIYYGAKPRSHSFPICVPLRSDGVWSYFIVTYTTFFSAK